MVPPEQRSFRQALARAVVLPLVVTFLLAAVLLIQVFHLIGAARWVDHTDLVIAQANQAEKLLLDLDSSYHAYLITGQSDFQTSFDRTAGDLTASLGTLKWLVRDRPPQVRRATEIQSSAETWNSNTREGISRKNHGRAYVPYVLIREDRRLIDTLLAEFDRFLSVEQGLHTIRRQTERTSVRQTLIGIAAAGILLGVMLGLLTVRELSGLSRSFSNALQSAQTETDRANSERERFETTLASIGDAVIATDSESRVTFMNPIALELTGWTRAEAEWRPLTQIFHIVNEETGDPAVNPVDRVIREGVVVGLANHTALIARNGSTRSIEDTAAPIKDQDGNTLGVVLVFRDTTLERQAERERADLMRLESSARAEAEQTSQHLRFLAEASRILSSSLDYQTTLDQVAHLAVRSLADWCAIDVLEDSNNIRRVAVAHPDPRKVEMAYDLERRYPLDLSSPRGVPNVIRTGESEIYPEITDEMLVQGTRDEEHLRLSRNLGLRSALLVPLIARSKTLGVISFFYAESGRHYTEQDLSLAQDLARRAGAAVDNARLYTEAQAALRLHEDLERRLTSLTDATAALVTSLERDRLLSEVLALAQRLVTADAFAIWLVNRATGQWDRPASIGLSDSFLDALPETDLSRRVPQDVMIVEDVTSESLLVRRQEQLQAEGIKSMLIMPLRSRGELVGTLVCYHRSRHAFDATELKVARALGHITSSTLSTASLYQELHARAELLSESDRLKDHFLAMLAHELRNPLGAITNACQVMGLASPSSEAYQRAHSVLVRQSQHMAHLVDQLLDVSRITHGKFEVSLEALDLVELLRVTCEDYRRILDAAGVTLELDLPREPLYVEGDPTRLRQAIGNLLQNAAKFTPSTGRVDVMAAARTDQRMATVTVTDTGAGISPELIGQLFEPFVQADTTLNRSKGGLGLGLALVKAIVDRHHGTVGVRSGGIGQGATFTIELPLAGEPAVNQDVPPQQAQLNPSLRILIIEDNEDAALTLKDVLEIQGFRAEIALSGAAGLAIAQRIQPQVILCDLGLPGMDGYEVARSLRSSPATASLRLIAVSGYGRDEDKRRSRDAGFDHHLTKPIDFEQLRAAITDSPANDAEVPSPRTTPKSAP